MTLQQLLSNVAPTRSSVAGVNNAACLYTLAQPDNSPVHTNARIDHHRNSHARGQLNPRMQHQHTHHHRNLLHAQLTTRPESLRTHHHRNSVTAAATPRWGASLPPSLTAAAAAPARLQAAPCVRQTSALPLPPRAPAGQALQTGGQHQALQAACTACGTAHMHEAHASKQDSRAQVSNCSCRAHAAMQPASQPCSRLTSRLSALDPNPCSASRLSDAT